ncbi:hypothetical protein [Caldibacillus thermoamylovorans]|uniref:hypothetical protein n=1 Tax=Caldibacillus thermoamylovorans TaxID=35841 RepID=UPI00203F5AB9|nr:hypothetical protein [Caldibacillus thermoamylovorans]MCM3478953.1 hypothetical protein [Caldibacillus thermoamylovorans]
MNYIELFTNQMKIQFNLMVNVDEVSYEGISLFHDEIDESFIPREHLQRLQNPLLIETIVYTDKSNNEWIAGIVVDENKWLNEYMVIIKNNKRVFYKFLNEVEN